jgi:hypothetical protein
MSLLPAPAARANREPFTKSAPEVSAVTNVGISAGSVEPSPSTSR